MKGWELARSAETGDLVKVQELAGQVSDFAREEALREAARGGHLDVVRRLVDQHAVDVNAEDNREYTALIRAAEEGHTDIVRFLAEQCGADVNVEPSDGYTALICAAVGGYSDLVRLLVEQYGADAKATTSYGSSALICAAGEGHLDIVRFLIEQCDADVTAKTTEGYTALHGAARGGHLDVVQHLAEQCGADVDAQDGSGYTALIWAARGDHLDVVRYLALERKADINAKDEDGSTALIEAARGGYLEVAQFLAEQCGADVNAKTTEGYTAMILAAKRCHSNVVRFLAEQCGADANITTSDGDTALIEAARCCHPDVVRLLAEQCRADVNARNEDGYTALIWAARHDHLDVVRFLVEHCNADVNAETTDGYTALIWASQDGYLDVARFLAEQCGANVNTKTTDGYTALIWATRRGHLDIVRMLGKECSADVNAKDEDGCTALLGAAQNGNLEVLRLLVEQCGADVNAKDEQGCTALIWAARNFCLDVVRFLVEQCGVDVNTTTTDGYTALIWAARNGYLDVARLLAMHCGANVNAKTTDGYTPLIWAARGGHLDVVRLLAEDCNAHINDKDEDGNTALIWAAQEDCLDIVKSLAEQHNADVNAKNQDGYTALMCAARDDCVDIVKYLAEQCAADVSTENKDGQTAVRIATDRGHEAVKRILMPLVLPTAPVGVSEGTANGSKPSTNRALRCAIPPSEIALTGLSQTCGIGGDFHAKWLDADAVVKLFIPDAAHSAFDDEVRLWQQLRHPNVIKMYGACQTGPRLQFFVCEYASQGSLWEFVTSSSESKAAVWRYLHEAALGLEYLHERGIVHGDLRCNNILIGSDGMAKLSNFGLSGRMKKESQVSANVIGSMRWQAPEVLRGEPPSFESDVYALGMCIWEAVEGEIPWGEEDDEDTRAFKLAWKPEEMGEYGEATDSDSENDLVYQMCCQDPHKRASLSSIVYELERLAIKESSKASQPELEPANSFNDYECGKLTEAWEKLQVYMEKCNNAEYRRAFDELKIVHEHLTASTHHPTQFARFDTLLTEFYQTVKMSPEQARIVQLSSTRATASSMYALQWRINSLRASGGEALRTSAETKAQRQQLRNEEAAFFVSGVTDTFLLLNDLKSVEERSAFLRMLKAEMEDHVGKYTPEQHELMKKTYEDITSALGGDDVSELTPEWFIPWYELIVDEWNCLGEGGFGSVHRAKWLDSDVVVKRVTLAVSHSENSTYASDLADSFTSAWDDPSASQAQVDAAKRADALAMFRREVDIWFGFSHPHVVRLFGACHVGRPFFVCEYAPNGTLVSYLQAHPDEVWVKLHEAALGIQYLHAREVVHGDLKGNNIVIGSDMRAKVTDFGLSSVTSSDNKAQVISGAWQWVAPELLGTNSRPSFASDMYSLGMCIVEALRVVEAVKLGKDSRHCLPWCLRDINAVKYHATHGKLPTRPAMCADSQWELVKRMCAFDPEKRIKISTVVDELATLANIKNASSESSELDGISRPNPVSWESVAKVIEAAQRELKQLEQSEDQQDEVQSLYVSLLERLEQLHGQIHGSPNEECRAAFCSLVGDLKDAIAKLPDRKANLVSLAATTMECYALGRTLSKWCDVNFIVGGKEPAPAAEHFSEGRCHAKWRGERCSYLPRVGSRLDPTPP